MMCLQIKEHPLYHLIKARILKKQGNNQDALDTLKVAMQLPGVKGSYLQISCIFTNFLPLQTYKKILFLQNLPCLQENVI